MLTAEEARALSEQALYYTSADIETRIRQATERGKTKCDLEWARISADMWENLLAAGYSLKRCDPTSDWVDCTWA